jgi:hypothetical protein
MITMLFQINVLLGSDIFLEDQIRPGRRLPCRNRPLVTTVAMSARASFLGDGNAALETATSMPNLREQQSTRQVHNSLWLRCSHASQL